MSESLVYCAPCRRAVRARNHEAHLGTDIHRYWLHQRGADYTDHIAADHELAAAAKTDGRTMARYFLSGYDEGWVEAHAAAKRFTAALEDKPMK